MNTRLVALLATLLLILAACGGADDDSSESSGYAGGSTEGASKSDGSSGDDDSDTAGDRLAVISDDAIEADTYRAEGGAPLAPAQGTVQPTAGGEETVDTPDPIETGRDIIRTATVTAEVPDVAAASQEVLNAVQAVGGLLFNQDTRIAAAGEPNRTTMVFRVPPSDFQAVLNELSGVGKLLEQKVDATDVTGRIVDLESRITSTELSVERLRGFLAAAQDLNQIATFENELRNRETDLETLRGQLRTVRNQVALSTITITLIEKVPPAAPNPRISLTTTMHKGHDGGFSCGTEAASVESGTEVTLCYDVLNNGETALIDINVGDSALGVEFEDLELVQGSAERALEPGQHLVYAYELTASGTRVVSAAKVRATAVPALDAIDTNVGVDTVDDTEDLAISVAPRQTDPGFSDGLSTGWNGLTEIIRMLLVVAGFALPFIWVFPLAFFFYRAWRRRFAVGPVVLSPPPAAASEEKRDEPVPV
jgi:hypothetical protein